MKFNVRATMEAHLEQRLLNVKELSAYLSMPTATIYTYISTGKIPSVCVRRIGRSLKFEKAAVDGWISGQAADRGRVLAGR